MQVTRTDCYSSFIPTNVKVNMCYLSACTTTINADTILGNSKGTNAQINVLHGHGFRDSRNPCRTNIQASYTPQNPCRTQVLHGSGAYENKSYSRSYLPHDFKSLDELSDSADHALFRVIVFNPHSVLHPLLHAQKNCLPRDAL